MLQFDFELNSMQKEAISLCGKNISISAPTGSGKTEALLLAIPTGSKVSYLLPTITSCVFMYKRLCDQFDNIDVAIKTSVLTDVRICTNPEFVVTIMCPDAPLLDYMESGQKTQTLDDVLILDELDNYPVMVKRVLIDYIEKMRPQTLIASATLDKVLIEMFNKLGFDTISYRNDLKLIKHKVDILNADNIENLAQFVRSNPDKRIGFIMNSISGMEEIRSWLVGSNGIKHTDMIFHHSQITEFERLKNEERLYNGDFRICVSNDCISFSVDIDFDILFMEVSDKMSINLQRMGRNNRYNRPVTHKNLYLIHCPFIIPTPPFIDSYEARRNFRKLYRSLTYQAVQEIRDNLEFEKIPSLKEVKQYLHDKKSQGMPLDLRQVPYTFELPTTYVETVYDPNLRKKVTVKHATTQRLKVNGQFPWGWFPYESDDAEYKTIVHIKGKNYRIQRQLDNGNFLIKAYNGYMTDQMERDFYYEKEWWEEDMDYLNSLDESAPKQKKKKAKHK